MIRTRKGKKNSRKKGRKAFYNNDEKKKKRAQTFLLDVRESLRVLLMY